MLSTAMGTRLRVFVADDDPEMLAFICELLEAHGCVTQAARDGEELLDQLIFTLDQPRLRPDVLVLDVRMPRLSGLGVLSALRKACWQLPVIMITVMKDESVRAVAKRHGAVGMLKIPFDPDDLVTAVQNAGAIQHLSG